MAIETSQLFLISLNYMAITKLNRAIDLQIRIAAWQSLKIFKVIHCRWMPLDLTDDKSTLVQVMSWCRQATSHYLCQCWPRSMSPNGVTRPQWVDIQSAIRFHGMTEIMSNISVSTVPADGPAPLDTRTSTDKVMTHLVLVYTRLEHQIDGLANGVKSFLH